VTRSLCGPRTRWCVRTDELFDVEGGDVVDMATRDDGTMVLDVEIDQTLAR